MKRSVLTRISLMGILTLAALLLVPGSSAAPAGQRAGFPATLAGQRVGFGSVTLADLDGDSQQEILVGGQDGYVYAVNADGSVRWTYDASAAIDARAAQLGLRASAGRIPIRTAPAVADVTGDGQPEVIVTAGEIFPASVGLPTYNGGALVLSKSGQILPGWPQLPRDLSGPGDPTQSQPADGLADGILTSPTVGDITGDGVPEIAFTALDQQVYVKAPNGSDVAGWPQFILDTAWSTAAMGDLDGDGVAELIVGVDAHFYRGPPRNTDAGGDLYAFKGDGSILWRVHQDEIFQSSPAVADLDGDGSLEIAIGTGTFYGNLGARDAQGVRVGQYFSVFNHDGSLLWRATLPERVFGSAAVGDITGDGGLEVVVGALNGYAYAFDGATGAVRWSTKGVDIFNNQYLATPELYSPVLGDYTGDGREDVFITLGWDVLVMRGTDGALLTGTSPTGPQPSYYTDYTILGTPAVGDLDGNGKLDLVAASGATGENRGRVYAWELASSTPKATWPMFMRNPANTGLLLDPQLQVLDTLTILVEAGETTTRRLSIRANDGRAITWSVQASDPAGVVDLDRTSGSASDPLTVTVGPKGSPDSYSAQLTVQATGLPDATINLQVIVVNQLSAINLPAVQR